MTWNFNLACVKFIEESKCIRTDGMLENGFMYLY